MKKSEKLKVRNKLKHPEIQMLRVSRLDNCPSELHIHCIWQTSGLLAFRSELWQDTAYCQKSPWRLFSLQWLPALFIDCTIYSRIHIQPACDIIWRHYDNGVAVSRTVGTFM